MSPDTAHPDSRVVLRAALAGDRVALGAGAPFPRDTVLQFEGTQIKPLRLDAAVVFIKHAARNGWNWKADIAAYIKACRAPHPPCAPVC